MTKKTFKEINTPTILAVLFLFIISIPISFIFVLFSGDILNILHEYVLIFYNTLKVNDFDNQGLSIIQTISDFSGLILGVPVAILGSFTAIYLAHRSNSISDVVRDITERQDRQEFIKWLKDEFQEHYKTPYDLINSWSKLYLYATKASVHLCKNSEKFYTHISNFSYHQHLILVSPKDSETIKNCDDSFSKLCNDFFEELEFFLKSIDDFAIASNGDNEFKSFWFKMQPNLTSTSNTERFFAACDAYLRDSLFSPDNLRPLKEKDAYYAISSFNGETFLSPKLQAESSNRALTDNITNIIGAAIYTSKNKKKNHSELSEKERDAAEKKAQQQMMDSREHEETNNEEASSYAEVSGGDLEGEYVLHILQENKLYVEKNFGEFGAENFGIEIIKKLFLSIKKTTSGENIKDILSEKAKSYFFPNKKIPKHYEDIISEFLKRHAKEIPSYAPPSDIIYISTPSAEPKSQLSS